MIECNKITKNTKDLMLSLINKSEKDNREHGLLLCKEENGDITHSNICVGGSNCEIILKDAKCPVGTIMIGDFHTHPGRGKIPSYSRSKPSIKDIAATTSYGRKSLCIGYSHRSKNHIKCYDITDKTILELCEKSLQNRESSFELYKEIYYKVQELYRKKIEVLNNECLIEQKINRNK